MPIIKPQPGFQEKFLSTAADIAIGGGSAGGGKTYAMLMEPLRHYRTLDFGATIFRRTRPQIKTQGGLWDTSGLIYPAMNAVPKESQLTWLLNPSSDRGARVQFTHLEYEKTKHDYQGSQIPLIEFDELTHFSESVFWYMVSRNRSTCGVKPYVRATCNPDPDSFVAKLVEWYIDPVTGLPIPERDGVIRYLLRDGKGYIWGDTKEEVREEGAHILSEIDPEAGINPDDLIKSFTFIHGSVYGNKELLAADPNYLGNLLAQDDNERERLLKGCWKHFENPSDLYDFHKFNDVFNNSFVMEPDGDRYITADIALKGSDKLVVGAWRGFELVDVVIMDKSDGGQVINAITDLQGKWHIPNSSVAFDNDGVGGFIDGFIDGAREFKNGSKALDSEEYKNLKTQCYYKSANRVKNAGLYISPEAAEVPYDDMTTFGERLKFERKAIRRDKIDHDGKLQIIPKEKMKPILHGESPDCMDMIMMREYFELNKFDFWISS